MANMTENVKKVLDELAVKLASPEELPGAIEGALIELPELHLF